MNESSHPRLVAGVVAAAVVRTGAAAIDGSQATLSALSV